MMTDISSDQLPTPEFSRALNIESVKIGKSEQNLEATSEECAKLAGRLDLLAVDHLSANLRLNRKGQGDSIRVSVSGHLKAQVTQACVISLEPVSSVIEADVDAVFDSDADSDDGGLQIDYDVDLENEDITEPIIDGVIDLGELCAQVLATEIDPFLRKEGADSSEMTLESADSEENPFSVLKKLKREPN